MLPKVLFTLLFIGIAVIPNAFSWKCKNKVTRIGCYKQWRVPFDKLELLYNDRININWGNYRSFLIRLVCNCAEAASKKNYKYFAIRYYGECMGGNLPAGEVQSAGADKRSNKCVNEEYKTCAPNALLCAGGGMTDSLFEQEPLIAYMEIQKPPATTTQEPKKYFETTPKRMTFPTFPPIPGGPHGGFPPIPNPSGGNGGGFPPMPNPPAANGGSFPPIPNQPSNDAVSESIKDEETVIKKA